MELLLLVAAGIVVFVGLKAARSRTYPHRLMDLEQALRLHATARRQSDPEGAAELMQLADDLAHAQRLVNGGDMALRAEWRRLRPQLLHLTGEAALQRVDLFYSDRKNSIQQAVYDLVKRIDARTN
ncbi:hypothetical protein [Scleromatobacter humisilvae]|uniref:DUF2489 domain-containing protein n=1 Tax=Scleromatobacter humisilvae TaxID=2897159 RepID=A0A9X1YKY1_9BURK|nr:hypothetical protein [Scleromatobacter humisilvae]MCK9688464.1 hypothetical protein [Scleromatobacter humisilvae]